MIRTQNQNLVYNQKINLKNPKKTSTTEEYYLILPIKKTNYKSFKKVC